MSTASASIAGDESSFVRRINAARASRGLAPLQTRDDLTTFARRHSSAMAAAGSIFHSRSFDAIGGWTIVGENVGTGSTVAAIQDAFMNSLHHRENILYTKYNQVGVGVAMAGGKLFVTQIFVRRVAAAQRVRALSSPPAVKAASSTVTFTLVAPKPPVLTAIRTVDVLSKLASLEEPGSGAQPRRLAAVEA